MIADSLFVSRYDDVDYTGNAPVESIHSVQDIGLRWSIAGGLQRLEVTMRAHSDFDAWDRYQNHLGHRIAVYDGLLDRYIAGTVYEIVPDGRLVTYICAGPWKRVNDDIYSVSQMSDLTLPTDDTDVVVKDILDDVVTVSNSDQSNIDSTGEDIGAWTANRRGIGVFAGEAIEELTAIGTSGNAPLDFYFVDAPFSGVQLQKPLPYLKARSTTASPDWQFERADLASGGLSLSRNVWNLARDQRIGYGRVTGTDDGTGSRANLEDSGADFLDGRFSVGMRVVNVTQNTTYRIDGINNPTTLDLNSEGGTEFTNGDRYVVFFDEPTWTTVATSSETDLWTKKYREERLEMDATQAADYGAHYMATYEKPVQQQAFVISAPTIRDGNGTRWPLWRPLMGDSFYFRITDLFPEAAVFGASDDRSQTFIATAMDYSYRNNRLRVVPGTNDTRLDVLMQQALAEKRDLSQIVSTATGR
jgi:hypothetical protein